MQYATLENTPKPAFIINSHIGYDADMIGEDGSRIEGDGQGVDGETFAMEFFKVQENNPSEIDIFINSMGGSVLDGMSILTAIINSRVKTNTYISGYCLSTAGWIALCADKVRMYAHSCWMCHMPIDAGGNADNGIMGSTANMIANAISQRSGRNGKNKLSVEDVKNMMSVKTYMNAEQMYNMGLIDEVLPMNFNRPVIYNKETFKECKNILNTIVNKKPSVMPFEKVINRLKLAPNSSEEDVLSALASLENKISITNAENVDLKNKVSEVVNLEAKISILNKDLEAKDADSKALLAKIEKLEISNKELSDFSSKVKKEQEEADLLARTEKATNLVNTFKERGVIKEQFAQTWVKQAIENYDATEAQLESLNVSIKLPVAGGKREVEAGDIKNYEGYTSIKEARETIRLANQNKTK